MVPTGSRGESPSPTCLGGTACPGGYAGDQRDISLGRPASDGHAQPGVYSASALSAGCPRYLPVATPSCSWGPESFYDSAIAPAGHRATNLLQLPFRGVDGMQIASIRQ